jgi:DNA repair protein RadC
MTGVPIWTNDVRALAERHVAEAEERCARQAALLAQLIAHGHPRAVPLAERLLETFGKTRDLMREHRDSLLRGRGG